MSRRTNADARRPWTVSPVAGRSTRSLSLCQLHALQPRSQGCSAAGRAIQSKGVCDMEGRCVQGGVERRAFASALAISVWHSSMLALGRRLSTTALRTLPSALPALRIMTDTVSSSATTAAAASATRCAPGASLQSRQRPRWLHHTTPMRHPCAPPPRCPLVQRSKSGDVAASIPADVY